jgi:hypothetical protein
MVAEVNVKPAYEAGARLLQDHFATTSSVRLTPLNNITMIKKSLVMVMRKNFWKCKRFS